MTIIDQASEILKQPIGWIELDIDIDLSEWKKEAKLVEKYLVEHREGGGHSGWRSCCLHGIDTDKTGHWYQYSNTEDDIIYQWTELTTLCPTITKFWKSFPTERFARLRFMEVGPGGWVAPHNDSPNGIKNTEFNMMDHMIPVNIAIVHPLECYMELEDYGRVPWKEGKAFIVNITSTHHVKNLSKVPRMHMIAHCIIGDKRKEFSELVVRSYERNNL